MFLVYWYFNFFFNICNYLLNKGILVRNEKYKDEIWLFNVLMEYKFII